MDCVWLTNTLTGDHKRHRGCHARFHAYSHHVCDHRHLNHKSESITRD